MVSGDDSGLPLASDLDAEIQQCCEYVLGNQDGDPLEASSDFHPWGRVQKQIARNTDPSTLGIAPPPVTVYIKGPTKGYI